VLIGLNGKKQAGKDTAFARMVERLPQATVERVSNSLATVEVYVRGRDVLSRTSVREYLQHYGTEAHRDVFGPNFWVDNVDLSHDRRIVVVTDVRFANEAQAVHDAGGVVVRVIGPPEVEEAGDGHASEAELPYGLLDGAIYNTNRDDGFESLDRQVLDLVLGLLREERVTSERFTA
jgi:hypothetical protein